MIDKSQDSPHAPTDASADALAASLFSEVFISDQLARDVIGKVLPKGMQISHFSVLNLLAHLNVERSPAELAEAFHVTRAAMTNTLSRLEWAGYIHIRPDWDDARRKFRRTGGRHRADPQAPDPAPVDVGIEQLRARDRRALQQRQRVLGVLLGGETGDLQGDLVARRCRRGRIRGRRRG